VAKGILQYVSRSLIHRVCVAGGRGCGRAGLGPPLPFRLGSANSPLLLVWRLL
jgi:hypothetical protein